MVKFIGMCVCLSFLLSAPVFSDDDDDLPQKNTVRHEPAKNSNPQNSIFLDKSAQVISGIKTTKLKSSSYQTELLSYGSAISAEPLLALQNQYLNAIAQQKSAEAKAKFSQNSLSRLTYLHKEQIISTHALQSQQATWQEDKALLLSSHYTIQQIINNARLVWGQRLTDWMTQNTSDFTALMQQSITLVKVIFPLQLKNTSHLRSVFLAASDNRKQAVMAELVSAIPQTDSFSQGQQYFYQVPSRYVKPGMRVTIWIPTQQASEGVIIPESALIWHLGQPLVFVKKGNEEFIHRFISYYTKIASGYFVSVGLKAGDEVVTSGAQMLLSQEFKGQIPDEDDD